MREFMQIVESSEVDRLTELAKKHDDVESFLNATDGMDVLYRGHGEDEVPNDSFMSDYIGHARGYGGGHVDAFAVDLYNDVYRFRDDQFDQMRFALRRLDDEEFAEHYARVLPERMSGFFEDWFSIVKQVIEDDEPFEEVIATDPQKNDAMIPLMQAWGASKGKNIICFMGGDYGDYGGQMEFVVHDVSKLVNLRKLYAQVHQQVTESYLESGRAPLYHWTNPESARYILEKGKITASLFGVGQVCVTRDRNFHFNKNCVRMEIDADVVGRNLKVTPYDYSHNGHSWGTAQRKEEREERIHGDVSIRAITAITLFDNGFAMKNAYWSKQIEAMLANAKAAGIPVTIEESPHKVQESVEGGWPQEIDGNTLWRKIEDDQLHHTPTDFDDGDLIHNISSFGRYELRRIPVEGLKLGIYAIDDDLVGDYAGMDGASQPPIVFNPIHNLIIDGNHRANAAAKRGDHDILAYVGDPSTYSPPEDEDDDGEWHPSEEY